jgi:DNA-binding CsgD family transcriptional regulator/PAS domain-containing protein
LFATLKLYLLIFHRLETIMRPPALPESNVTLTVTRVLVPAATFGHFICEGPDPACEGEGYTDHMREFDELTGLISAIYDTVLNETLWPDVLKKVAAFVGGPNAGLWSKDVARHTGNTTHNWGFDPGYVRAYFDEYIKLDPAAESLRSARLCSSVTRSAFIPEAEYVETRLYREWARPQGFVDCIHVAIDRSGESLALLAVSRHKRDGVADHQTCRRIELLAPHVRHAVLIAKAIDVKHSQAASLAQLFDTLHAGIFVVDAGGRLIDANAAGERMLAERNVLRVSRGRLVCSNRALDYYLPDIFAAVRSDTAGARGLALPLSTRSDERYVARVLPLRSGLRSHGGKRHATAALIVHKAALTTPLQPEEVIARSYQLTPTELKVLLAIFEVGGAPEVAEALGIATSTVKTHLSRLYEKTGTRRQADLVKLVAGFVNPFLD